MGSAQAKQKMSSCASARERQLEPKWEAHRKTPGVAQAVHRWKVSVWAAEAKPDGEFPTSFAAQDDARQTSPAPVAAHPKHPVVQLHWRMNSVQAGAPLKKPPETAKTPTDLTPVLRQPSLLLL